MSLVVLGKKTIVSDAFKVMGCSFQTLGAATEKPRLPKFSFVVSIITCCEMDDLSGIAIFERSKNN